MHYLAMLGPLWTKRFTGAKWSFSSFPDEVDWMSNTTEMLGGDAWIVMGQSVEIE